MKTIASLSLIVVFFICQTYATHSPNLYANCMTFDMIPQYEKFYPCVWTDELLSWRDKSIPHSAVFKCRDVPTTASLSYSMTINGNNTNIPYSVSLWAVDAAYVLDSTDTTLYNNFYNWAVLGAGNRASASPQCLNDPECLTSSNADHSLVSLALGGNVGISQTTTYNLYILNENPDVTNPSYEIQETWTQNDYIQRCFSILAAVSIE